jgi:bacillithiol system protein YtxJ
VSYDAYNEVARFELMHPEVPVHLLDVVLFRSLARHVADVTGIGHHSPQVIVVKDGIVRWHGSHYAINALVLERHVTGIQSANAEKQS